MAADLTEALFTRALANSALTAVLGTGDAARLYPVQAPQKATLPFAVFEVISEPRTYAGGGYAGLTRARVMFSACAVSHAGAVALDRLLRDTFNAYTGASIVTTGGTVVVLSMEPQSPRDIFDDTTQTYWRSRDVLFWWRDNT